MDCDICLDSPPNPATLLIGDMYSCAQCFDDISPSMSLEGLTRVEILDTANTLKTVGDSNGEIEG